MYAEPAVPASSLLRGNHEQCKGWVMVLSAEQAARYYLAKDSQQTVFKNNLIQRDGRLICEESMALNAYLHMAQN